MDLGQTDRTIKKEGIKITAAINKAQKQMGRNRPFMKLLPSFSGFVLVWRFRNRPTCFAQTISGYAKKTTVQVETLIYNDRQR